MDSDQDARMNPLTLDDLRNLHNEGVIGLIEFRNWLQELYPEFGEIRDADVDAEIEEDAAEEIRLKRRYRALPSGDSNDH